MPHDKKYIHVKVDEEKFIKAIRDRPQLYDPSDVHYRKRNEAWKEVAKIFGIPENDCKKRWKSLRDGLRKHMKWGTGSYLHYNAMKFLKPYIKSSLEKTSNGKQSKEEKSQKIILIRNDEEEDDVVEYLENFDGTKDDMMEIVEHDKIDYEDYSNSRISEHSKDHQTIETQNCDKIIEAEVHFSEGTASSVNLDKNYQNLLLEKSFSANERFLLSLAPILDRLPNKKNTIARMKIQHLLFELEYDEKS